MVKHLSSDWLYVMMRGSDELVNNTVALAFFDNTLRQNGQIISIPQMVRARNDWDQRTLKYPNESDRNAFEKKVSAEIEDLKKNFS